MSGLIEQFNLYWKCTRAFCQKKRKLYIVHKMSIVIGTFLARYYALLAFFIFSGDQSIRVALFLVRGPYHRLRNRGITPLRQTAIVEWQWFHQASRQSIIQRKKTQRVRTNIISKNSILSLCMQLLNTNTYFPSFALLIF